jgi:hypothetical protein
MLMLDKWRRMREGNSLRMPDLEDIVYQPKKIAEQSINLFDRANIGTFLHSYRFLSRNIDMTPMAFKAQLAQGKPFGYVARAGNGYQHTLVVTGIEKRTDLYQIFYNDPAGGRVKDGEFFEFASEHPPAWGDMAFIIIPN